MGKLRIIVSLAAVFAVAFTGTAVANHVFNDVPTSSEFHDEIAEIGDAACAEGFPGGLFKPNDPVKRQQMARFLSRCGGRVAGTSDTVSAMGATNTYFEIADLPFTPTANGFVMVTATGTSSTGQEGLCPCQVRWQLFADGSPIGREAIGQLTNVATEVGTVYEPMVTTGVFAVNANESVTYSVRGKWIDDDTTFMNFETDLTIAFFPFAG